MAGTHGEADAAAWAPSTLHEVAAEVVGAAVEGPVHVRGRVVDTGASRTGTQFVTLVDEDVAAPRWDTPRLGLVVFAWRARWLERPLGGPVSEALTTGTVVDAVGELGIAPGDGALQLRTDSIAVAAASQDAAAVEALHRRILDEDWVASRPALPRVLRRVGALISVAGDGDLDEALRLLDHDPFAPAFCRHRIHPLSATAALDVPALLDHHVASGVDAVLIAFGGHLPPVSAWDSEEVLTAIHRAHLAGVPVVAGFAHGRDQPLTKLVAHNRGQASTAVTALVGHNRALLGRVGPAVAAAAAPVDGAAARLDTQVRRSLRRSAATSSAVASGLARRASGEVERVVDAAAPGRLAPVAGRARRTVAALGDPGAALRRRLADATDVAAGAAGRVAADLATRQDRAGQLPRLLGSGLALVSHADGAPLPDEGPVPGSRVRVTTARSTFTATVDPEDDR